MDGVRRLSNVSPADMSDHDIRVALSRLAAEYDAERTAQEAAESVRRFAYAVNLLTGL